MSSDTRPDTIEVAPNLAGDFSDYAHIDGVLVRADLVRLTPAQEARFIDLMLDETCVRRTVEVRRG